MNRRSSDQQDPNELRRRAEETLKAKTLGQANSIAPEGMTLAQVQALIHDLQVHQIELEMQNEELQQAQVELGAARDRYFDLFDLAPVGYFMLDQDGLIEDVNLSGANLLGVPRSNLPGRALSHYIYESDQDNFYLHRRKAYQTRARVECELRMLKTDGSIFYAHLEYAQTSDQTGPTNLMRLIVRDITQRALLEQSLVKNEAILSAAERIAHLGGWEWDIENDEVKFSQELQRIYRCEKLCYCMDDFLLLAHPEDRAAKQTALIKALSGVEQLNFEHRILRQNDQAERYIHITGEVIFDKAGKPLKFIGASQDVTDLKMNERSLQSDAAHLKILNRDLESFTYIASHDLQAPLRKIVKFGEMARARLPKETDAEVVEYIERMQKSAARMQGLITDLLKYSRFSNGILSYEDVNLNNIVRDVLDDLDAPIKKSAAKVEVDDLPVLSAEPVLMQELFQNLLENALKFHQVGKAPAIKIKSRCLAGQMAEISVIDQGIGFDQENGERIFAPFERLHGVSEYAGSGVGLAICRKIVERHAGTITAHGEPGVGATFTVILPLQQV